MKRIVIGLVCLFVIFGSSVFAQTEGSLSLYGNSDKSLTFTPKVHIELLGFFVEGFVDNGKTLNGDIGWENYYMEVQAGASLMLNLSLVAEIRAGCSFDQVEGFGLQAEFPILFFYGSISAYYNTDKTKTLTAYLKVNLPAELYIEGWLDIYTNTNNFDRDFYQGEIQIGRSIGKKWRAIIEGRFSSYAEEFIGLGLQYYW